MKSIAEIVAALVVGTSAASYSHMGVTVEPKSEPAPQRVVSRRPAAKPCPELRRPQSQAQA